MNYTVTQGGDTMTLRQLAKLANVSVSTVSKAFCEADDISDETKQKIFELAKQHGCFGKYYKGKYHKKIIAILCHELNSSYYMNYVSTLQKIIEKNDGIVLISTDDFDRKKQTELIEYYASFLHVDGIFVIGMNTDLKSGYEIPIISLLSQRNTDSVNINFEPAMHEAVNLLYSLGHSDIAFIGEHLSTKVDQLFGKTMEFTPNDPRIFISDQRFQNAGKEGVLHFLEENIPFTALICAYDDIAYGAIRQLKKSGLRVPEDISVIGIDNISFSEHLETTLTSIDTNPDEVCLLAWDLMKKKLKNNYFKSYQNISISSRLIVRESVAKKRDKK